MTELPLIRWDVAGPYEVGFSTRIGGVSEGPFDSLNLGKLTDDGGERADAERLRGALDDPGEESAPADMECGQAGLSARPGERNR